MGKTKSVIIALDGRVDLAQQIIDSIDNPKIRKRISLDAVNTQKFSDGEFCVDFANSIRGKRVYLLTSPNTSDEIMKLNLAIDAAKRAAGKEIIPILPYFPYQRSDKKDQSRGPIGAKVIAEMIEQRGATGIITFDLHADQIQGFFNIPVTHLEGKNVFDSYIAEIYPHSQSEIILSSCDAGGTKRVKRLINTLKEFHKIHLNYVVIDKTRNKPNEVEKSTVIGDVKGKRVILIDDMIDTFGSADKAVNTLLENGAISVDMCASHGILSGPAHEKIKESKLNCLVLTDSLNIINNLNGKIKTLSVASLIAKAITCVNSHTSVEKTLGNKW